MLKFRDLKIARTKMTNQEIIENYNATMVTLLRWLKPEDVLSMALKVNLFANDEM